MSKNINILLIEDNMDDRELFVLLQRKITSFESYLFFGINLSESLDVLSKETIDIILLDLNLPDSKGLDSYRNIRKEFKKIPIVIMSGHDELDLAVKAIQIGAQDYLSKDHLSPQLIEKSIFYSIERNKLTLRNVSLISKLKKSEKNLKRKQLELEKSLKNEKELSELRAKFINGASHHFRTPLSIIQSNSQLLINAINQSRVGYEQLLIRISNRIKMEVERITIIMDSLLKIQEVVTNNKLVNIRPTDVVSLVNDTIQSVRQSISPDDRDMHLNIVGIPTLVDIDAETLKDALYQLIHNAFKYSINGTDPEIILEFGDRKLVIIIKDKGIGIPQSQIDSIFEPFIQSNNVTDYSGIGFGLTIAKRYIQLNKGSIEIESALKKGTKITISFPVSKDRETSEKRRTTEISN